MPYLAEISYSEEEFIAAIRDYYQFLTTLYLDGARFIIEPPEGGWPNITAETFGRPMGKSDAVVSLLRQLPYIRRPPGEGGPKIMAAPWCWMADWHGLCGYLQEGRANAADWKATTQNLNDVGIEWDLQDEAVPAHVIGLTCGGRDNSTILLDTDVGAIYWVGCRRIAGFGDCTDEDMINDDVMDYSEDPDNEWRGSAAWPVANFFKMLKQQYLDLLFIPLSSATVGDVLDLPAHDRPEDIAPGFEGVVKMLQRIYRQHGWPDVDRYRKEECLAAVSQALEEHCPLLVDVVF